MELIARQGERREAVSIERSERGYRVRVGANTYSLDVVATGGGRLSLLVDGAQHEVAVYHRGGGRYEVVAAGRPALVEVCDPLTELAGGPGEGRADSGRRQVTAYMPGRVVAVLVAEGTTVSAGQGLVVLEAMKMENEIQAERDGVVSRFFVTPGQAVEGGDLLFEIE